MAHLAELSDGVDADDKVIGGGSLHSVIAGARVAQKLFAFDTAMRRLATSTSPPPSLHLLRLLSLPLILPLLLLLVVQ